MKFKTKVILNICRGSCHTSFHSEKYFIPVIREKLHTNNQKKLHSKKIYSTIKKKLFFNVKIPFYPLANFHFKIFLSLNN